MKKLKLARDGYLAIALLFCIAAVVCLFFPPLPPLVLCNISGIILIAYGVIKIVGFFSEDLYCLAFRYDFAFGLLILVVGVLMLIKNNDVTGYLTPGLGWFTLLDSLFKIQMVKEASDFGLNGWNVILTIAIATGVISVLLIVGCFSSPLATKALVAGALLAEGCINFCVIQWAVRLPKPREAADKKEEWKENSP